MRAFPLTAETLPGLASRKTVIWSAIVVLSCAFYFIEHTNTQVSNLEAFSITANELAQRAAEGDGRGAWPFWRLGSLAHCCCSTLADGGWNSARAWGGCCWAILPGAASASFGRRICL